MCVLVFVVSCYMVELVLDKFFVYGFKVGVLYGEFS